MRTAAAYIRVSTEEQIEYSPDSQRKLILRYAAQHGWQVPDAFIFIDEGISGRKAEKRPAFMQMITMAKQNPKPFSAILVYSFSRFARNREDSVVYKRMLRKDLGIELISISQELGNDKTSVLVEALLEAMDEYYSVDLGENVRRGMVEKVERGEPVSVAPFGYRIENRRYVPSDQAPFVQEIFQLFVNGAGYREIALYLNKIGIRTGKGNTWQARGISYLLQNPVYIGKIRWSTEGRAGRSEIPRMVTQGNHIPLVDEGTWQLAQERLNLLRCSPRREKIYRIEEDGPLDGLVRCGSCGSLLVRSGRDTYQCSNYARGKCKISHSIGRKMLWKTICASLEEDLNGFHLWIPQRDSMNKTIQTAQKRAMERLERVEAAYDAGIDTLEEYARKKKELQEILKHCQNPQRKIHSPQNATIKEYLEGPAPEQEKNRFLSCFIDRIIFQKPYRFQIIYKL